jgi:hypothetical protein
MGRGVVGAAKSVVTVGVGGVARRWNAVLRLGNRGAPELGRCFWSVQHEVSRAGGSGSVAQRHLTAGGGDLPGVTELPFVRAICVCSSQGPGHRDLPRSQKVQQSSPFKVVLALSIDQGRPGLQNFYYCLTKPSEPEMDSLFSGDEAASDQLQWTQHEGLDIDAILEADLPDLADWFTNPSSPGRQASWGLPLPFASGFAGNDTARAAAEVPPSETLSSDRHPRRWSLPQVRQMPPAHQAPYPMARESGNPGESAGNPPSNSGQRRA